MPRAGSAAQSAGLAFAAAGRPEIPHPGERGAGGAAQPHRGGRRDNGGSHRPIMGFVASERGLSLASAAKVATALGLVLMPRR